MTSKRSATRFTTSTRRTREEPERQALTGRLDTTPNSEVDARSWNYVTLGYGHDATFWRSLCLALRRAGYDDVLSIEHEDTSMTPGGLERVTPSPGRVPQAVEGFPARVHARPEEQPEVCSDERCKRPPLRVE